MHTCSSTSINDANTKAVAYIQAGKHKEAAAELEQAMRILSSHHFLLLTHREQPKQRQL
jgi:hypothetical protein